jgi:hypothetical protein
MKCSNLIRAFALAVLVNCSFYAPGEGQSPKQDASSFTRIAREILQKWIAQDMHFFVDSNGASRLFLRRQPVRAAIALGAQPIKEEVNYLIARLSNAAGVPYEFTSSDVNIAIIVDTPINDGDKPNPLLWKRVGLSEARYKIVSEAGSWASGCGIYSFNNSQNGEVGLSITFADSKLEPARIKDCVIEGTIRAFGLRSHRKSTLLSDDGYIQFVALAKALSACERGIGVELLARMNESEQKLKYVECASELIEK